MSRISTKELAEYAALGIDETDAVEYHENDIPASEVRALRERNEAIGEGETPWEVDAAYDLGLITQDECVDAISAYLERERS